MSQLIDGKKISQQIKDELKTEVQRLRENGKTACLAVVQVGNDPASSVYVNNKKKACAYIGIESRSYELPDQVTEEELVSLVERLNADDTVNGILVRCGLQTMRMAAVLTAFRKYADWPEAREVTCTDEDFRAALQIASTVLEHSLLLSTSLPASDSRLQEMHRPRLIELVLDSLPEKFSYTEYMDATQEHDVPETTAKRWLRNLQKKQLVEKQEDGYRKRN